MEEIKFSRHDSKREKERERETYPLARNFPTWHSPLKEETAYGHPSSRQVIVYRMPTKKGRIWFINMMNDNEGKVSTEELTLRSNIRRGLAGLRIFWRIQIVTLSLSLSLSRFARPVFARLSRTMENETRSHVATDLSLHYARFIANSSFGNALLATLSRASRNFCSLGNGFLEI